MPKRTFLLLSVPKNFGEKLLGFIHNLNALNSDREPPIRLEGYHEEEEGPAADVGQGEEGYVAFPKTEGEKGEDQAKDRPKPSGQLTHDEADRRGGD